MSDLKIDDKFFDASPWLVQFQSAVKSPRWTFEFADRVPHRDRVAPSLLHGLLLLDAGGRPPSLEQSGVGQHQRGQSDEALLYHWLG